MQISIDVAKDAYNSSAVRIRNEWLSMLGRVESHRSARQSAAANKRIEKVSAEKPF